jgi:hypothetical protein
MVVSVSVIPDSLKFALPDHIIFIQVVGERWHSFWKSSQKCSLLFVRSLSWWTVLETKHWNPDQCTMLKPFSVGTLIFHGLQTAGWTTANRFSCVVTLTGLPVLGVSLNEPVVQNCLRDHKQMPLWVLEIETVRAEHSVTLLALLSSHHIFKTKIITLNYKCGCNIVTKSAYLPNQSCTH